MKKTRTIRQSKAVPNKPRKQLTAAAAYCKRSCPEAFERAIRRLSSKELKKLLEIMTIRLDSCERSEDNLRMRYNDLEARMIAMRADHREMIDAMKRDAECERTSCRSENVRLDEMNRELQRKISEYAKELNVVQRQKMDAINDSDKREEYLVSQMEAIQQ